MVVAMVAKDYGCDKWWEKNPTVIHITAHQEENGGLHTCFCIILLIYGIILSENDWFTSWRQNWTAVAWVAKDYIILIHDEGRKPLPHLDPTAALITLLGGIFVKISESM